MSMTPDKWTLHGLSIELKIDRQTLGRRLRDLEPVAQKGRSKLYLLTDVFRHLGAIGEKGNGGIRSSEEETARLRRAQAEKTELEVAERKGELLSAQAVTLYWSGLVANARARLLALPVKIAAGDRALQAQAKALIREVLDELAGDGIPACAGEDLPDGGEDLDAASRADDKRVVRPRKKAVKRGKRGTRKVADK